MTDTTTEPKRLEAGDTAPAFTLTDQSGNEVSLSDYAGQKVVLYTYPQAFTPGCTTEACDFRDSEARLTAAGYVVLAVSSDPVEKLARFKEEEHLPFTLLSDPDHEVQTAYAAYGEKQNYGRTYIGSIRSTFLIDEEGKIIEALYNVKATGHVDRVLKKLAA
ncbi:thioredoxin-dependent thiol peroxidase [Gulosibacter molinativorax]|uniref:thioredoxin-dependent thiol peroxidase n=1 Tax=Gulosibacter molinativorax TaxID=256821 RepID=UPI0003FBD243|nr:thioredoxin-dependent thiol peroxidase [Gulosibacter molinativorax]QUY62606.1 Peroxiredoxin [Gulosibacter molinativorax]